MRYEFIEEQKKAFPMALLCRLMEVSRRGYYDYQQRYAQWVEPSQEQAWVHRVKVIHEQTGGSDGRRRMAKPRQSEGHPVGRYQARSLMRQAGVVVKPKKRFRATTDSRHRYPVAPTGLSGRLLWLPPIGCGQRLSATYGPLKGGCTWRW